VKIGPVDPEIILLKGVFYKKGKRKKLTKKENI